MKKLLAVVLLLSLLIPSTAFAGRSTLDIDVSQCEQVSITAARSSNTSNMVKIYVDGVYVDGKTGWKTVSLTYTGGVSPGDHTAVAKYFERRWVNHEYIWDLKRTITRAFQIEACPPVGEQCGRCSNIKPFTYVEWFDRDGGCDGDWYNERVEYPDDERCGYIPPEPEPEPTPEPEPKVEVVPPKPLIPMWLLTRGDQGCILISETHPAVHRQNALCFPATDPNWTATNAPCAAYVYDDDTWACDRYGYYRLPLEDLLSMLSR